MKKIVFIVGLIMIVIVGGIYSYSVRAVEAYADFASQPVATVTLSTGDSFIIELYPTEAPNTVDNFIYLVQQGFYNGTKINRALPDYLIQGGDPIGNGKGFPGYFIKSECRDNGVNNTLQHKRGTVSMARSTDFDTEGSQFFVLLEDDRSLDGQYSAFGTVIEGLEVLEEISQLETNGFNYLINPITIDKVELETYGVAYNDPKVLSISDVLAKYE